MINEFNDFDLGDGTFGNTANLDPDALVTDNITLAFFAFDISSSMRDSMSALNVARRECIESWKKSHHADGILYSECTFNEDVKFQHGFDMVSTINPQDLTCGGTTALFEATLAGMKQTYDYKKKLEASGASVKCMVFVFTDGENNCYKVNEPDIIAYMNRLHSDDESTFSDFEVFIISIDKTTNRYFTQMKTQLEPCGIKVLVQDPTDTRSVAQYLRSFITVVSQSVSSGSTGNLTNISI